MTTSQTEEQFIFVYGTLRRDANHPAHYIVSKNSAFLEYATMPGCLFDLGEYPCMIKPQNDGDIVEGEIFSFTQKSMILKQLDQYEDAYPGTLYIREQCEATLASGKKINAWVYLYNQKIPNEANKILGGNYCKQP